MEPRTIPCIAPRVFQRPQRSFRVAKLAQLVFGEFEQEVDDRPSGLSVKRVLEVVCIPSQNGLPRNPGP